MKNMSIRLKTTLWFIVILAIIVSLTYFVFFSVSEKVVRSIIQEDVEDVVDINVNEIVYHPSMKGYNDIDNTRMVVPYHDGYFEIDKDFSNVMSGVVNGLFTKDGELIYGEDPIPEEGRSVAFQDGEIQTIRAGQDTFYIFDRQLWDTGGEDLWVRGVVDQDQRQGEVSRILRMSLYLLPLLILIAALGGYFIVRKALAPINRVTEAAKQISGGSDLKMRIEESGADDEVQQLARSFNEMIERLEESFESEKQFTSDVSHELRTPMSVILAQCELTLGEEELTEEEVREAMMLIQRQGNRMKEMINDMLTYTRIDRQHDRYPFEKINLSNITRNVCNEMGEIGETDEKNITIEIDIDEGIELIGNDKLLGRMVANLVGNAIKYGKERGHVYVSLHKDAKAPGVEEALLQVRDDGIGIEEEHLKRIFDRFYQANPARTSGGTGLGLSMVKEIVEKHKGTVMVDSTVDKGSTFTVRLPISESDDMSEEN